MATCNPFKVGDKVKLLKSSYDFNPKLWDAYEGYKYSFVTAVDGNKITTSEDKSFSHYTHFELYEEEKDMTPQTQPKTKRVPFMPKLWEKYKDVAKVYINGKKCDNFTCLVNMKKDQGFALYTYADDDFVHYLSVWAFELEIPVTTKRIPFNPELKDAKVVCLHTSDELLEWAYMNTSSVVCGVIKHECGGYITEAYHPNTLEMEIEEDA